MNDSRTSALDFVHRLLLRCPGDQPALAGLLAELATAFDVPAAGLASLPEGRTVVRHPPGPPACSSTAWPWQDDPALLAGCRQPPGAIIHASPAGRFLITSFTSRNAVSWALWLEGRGDRDFTDSDAATLSLAGHALAHVVGQDAQHRLADQLDVALRQERLETTAKVTRQLAHDFGNVLTGILGFTELAMTQQVPTSTPLFSYLQEVHRAAQTGAQFTQQLRLFSRRQSALSRTSQLANLLAEQEARLFAAQPDGLHLGLHVPQDLPGVGIDAEHVHQVLTPLLDNAREALNGAGAINVSARAVELTASDCRDLFGACEPGPHVEIIVADTGHGLTSDVQRRLFSEPFFTTKPRRRGFGLAVAYGILQAHKGGFRLHPGEERGAVARVLLPVAGEGGAEENGFHEPGTADKGANGAPAKPERILVVDDEPDVLNFVTVSLTKAGFRVDGVGSCEAALQLYFTPTSDPFHLVLTDVILPGMGGVELARRLLRRNANARVLFMSGHVPGAMNWAELTRPEIALPPCEILAKPFRAEQLVKAVRAVLDRPSRIPEPDRLPRKAADSQVPERVKK